MYSYIEPVRQRLDSINKQRIARSLDGMPDAFVHVYRLLPLFLHYDHPLLPGFLDGTIPHGVCGFVPDEYQLNYLASLPKINQSNFSQEKHHDNPITGVYTMGSTSSVGQSYTSDLDIWVCHQSQLDDAQCQKLHDKCLLLEKWADEQGVDVNFFLMDKNRFRLNKSGLLEGEDCGSTQHILLLEEFYRSAVKLAGKPLLWHMVPAEKEEQYDEYIAQMFADGALKQEEWIDLGGLGALSAEEYFGASLWQLYKSIDSPYKAVMKTLLLEAYSWEYPETKLLSVRIKHYLYENELVCYGLDAYSLMLARVTRYLISINDTKRLDLVRRCFYLKVRETLSKPTLVPNWRRAVLEEMVAEWGWSQQELEILDNRPHWKIELVRQAHDELLAALMQGYRNLIRFARRNRLTVSVSPQDIGVLTRKLYAAFENLPGKVTLVNPQISPDLSEQNLTFIHVPAGRANREGWYLYNQAPSMDSIISHQPLEYNRYLNKLVAWAYFNGLLTSNTRLHIKSGNHCDLDKLKALVVDIAQHFSLRLPAPTPKELYSPCEIKHLAIIVNLEQDPTWAFGQHMLQFDLRRLDVFSYGEQEQCLVQSIDLLYRNSWNEVRTLHFSGEDTVLEALKTILGKMHQDAERPKVDVFCYSQHLSGLLRSRIQQVVSECLDLRLNTERYEPGRFKPLRISGQTWGLFFERLSVTAQRLDNAIDFYGAISNNKLHGSSEKMSQDDVQLPAAIDGFASEGIIQFFFESQQEQGFNVYILDEENNVEAYHHCEGNQEDLVREVSRFYASHDRQIAPDAVDFNLPQFYHLVKNANDANDVEVIAFSSDALSHLCLSSVGRESSVNDGASAH